MLVANPGHTPYSFASSKINSIKTRTSTAITSAAPPTANHITKSSTSNDFVKNSLGNHISHKSIIQRSAISSKGGSSTSSDVANKSRYSGVINTLSVRINRGTELIKQTVNKALLSKLSSSFGGLLTVPPTATHRSPDRNTKSTDSLKSEMCHFKPIRTVPTTPSKRTKVIIRTPKAKRAQKSDSPCFVPMKNAVSFLSSPSQHSAFYLVKRSNELKEKSETKIVKSQAKNSNSWDSPTESKPITRLKRCRNNASSPPNDMKRNCLDDRAVKGSSSFSIENHINNNLNGLIVENGVRKSARNSIRKNANAIVTNSNTNTIKRNTRGKKEYPPMEMTTRSHNTLLKTNANNDNNGNTEIKNNNRKKKFDLKTKPKTLPQKRQQRQQQKQQQKQKPMTTRSKKQKSNPLKVTNNIECVHNLRPRIQKTGVLIS